MDLIKLAEEILAGKRLKREDGLDFFFTADWRNCVKARLCFKTIFVEKS